MFTDWSLTPSTSEQLVAAAHTTLAHARSFRELGQLLATLALPIPEELTEILTEKLTARDPAMRKLTAEQAMALTMHNSGTPADEITAVTGVSEDDLTALLAAAQDPTGTDTDPADPAADPAPQQSADDLERLLAWADRHSAAAIRNRAARIRADLAELTERRALDAAQREAEQRVAQARAELEAAQAHLRRVKGGQPAAAAATPAAAATLAAVAQPAALHRRSREDLARIRAWARRNGHTVSDRGQIPRHIQAAYDAAHPAAQMREAG
ncbi:hypothetical protein GCM10027168_44670 [Streptomyces capparidis]